MSDADFALHLQREQHLANVNRIKKVSMVQKEVASGISPATNGQSNVFNAVRMQYNILFRMNQINCIQC